MAEVDSVSPCVLTTYALTPDGYGGTNLRRFGKTIYRAHVAAWVEAHGRLPAEGMQINHHCDNRACVEVEHLYEGTQADNMRDVVVRNRRPRLMECPSGHRYEGDNVYYHHGIKSCRECRRVASETYRRKRGGRPQAVMRVLTDEQVGELKARVAAGEKQTALAREFGVGLRTVTRWVKK